MQISQWSPAGVDVFPVRQVIHDRKKRGIIGCKSEVYLSEHMSDVFIIRTPRMKANKIYRKQLTVGQG